MADHYVDIVNERDEVMGKELKSKKTKMGFISRVVGVMIQDSEGKFIICKRGAHKKLEAEKYDLAAFGNVKSGEDYRTAAARDLWEELNIRCPLYLLDKFYQEVDDSKYGKIRFFCGVFLGYSDEKTKLNHEVSSFKKMSFEELEADIKKNPGKFCQGFINDFNQIKEKLRFKVRL